jgi:homoserine kinase type II
LGTFLSTLYALEGVDEDEPVFDLPGFIRDLAVKISRNDLPLRSEMEQTIEPILERLESCLFPVYDKIPRVFGHGDCHPLNIIWGEDRILSVIDWECSGTKPLLYDAALVMGCVGSEDPDAMGGAFNREFYSAFSPEIPEDLKPLLPEFILALRFAWLNEWLRHDDREMIDQELYYMRCFHKGII